MRTVSVFLIFKADRVHYDLIMSLMQVHMTYLGLEAGGTAQQHIEQWPPSSSSAVLCWNAMSVIPNISG